MDSMDSSLSPWELYRRVLSVVLEIFDPGFDAGFGSFSLRNPYPGCVIASCGETPEDHTSGPTRGTPSSNDYGRALRSTTRLDQSLKWTLP